MENTAPADIDMFFTNLKNIWLKRQPSTFTYNGNRNLSIITTNSSPIPYQLQPQENKNRAMEHLESIAMRLGYSDNASQNSDALENFIEDELYARLGHANYYVKKEPFGQNNNTKSAKKVYTTKKPTKVIKVIYKCSNCRKIGHRKNKCPSPIRKCKKVNYIIQSEPENSDQENEFIVVLEDSDEEGSEAEESISDNESQSCFNEVFLESLKYMISELIPHCPKKILIEVRVFLNNLFIKMKDQFDSYYGEKYTVKERNKDQIPNSSSPKETNRDYELISQPEKLDNFITLNHAIKIYQGAQIRQNWPNPFEIDFLDIKEPNDVATISCRIGDLIIPHAILDTGADNSLFTDNIPEYLGIKINKKNVYKLTGAVGDSQSVGTSYNIPISIDSEKDSITVSEKEISVIPTKKNRNGKDISIMILGTKWQHHIRWDPIVKGEFIATQNGKTITIPLSTRKESRNAFNTEKIQASEV
ncbi:1569_t:CDS:2 [Ambispora gerdemannii]|uniref:1569_t:CDS:1 n=1 Tax=Ambispora gerdemannii TaxID=144530 RepID=A0A9N9GH34_9GLOM|nr:1569_t:CDS:2 [Ambispora gerdemannii]